MTLQDYLNLSQNSLDTFFTNFVPILTNIIAAIVTIAVGVIVGWTLKWVVGEISKAINLERTLSGLAWYSRITKASENLDTTTLVGETARWIAIVVFLIPAVSSLQINGSEAVFSSVFSYIGNVILASLYLLFGFVIAWFIKRSVVAVGVSVGTNPAHLLANFAFLAIVTFSAIQALLQLGVTADLIRLLVLAGFLASALAFGLAGRDTAADWLKKLGDKVRG